MRRLVTGLLVMGAVAALLPTAASARPPYAMAFLKNYDIKADSTLGKAGCATCHMGADKKVRNPYGADMAKALGKEKATPEEATAAIKKIEGMKSPDKKTTYLERIKADKLPAAP